MEDVNDVSVKNSPSIATMNAEIEYFLKEEEELNEADQIILEPWWLQEKDLNLFKEVPNNISNVRTENFVLDTKKRLDEILYTLVYYITQTNEDMKNKLLQRLINDIIIIKRRFLKNIKSTYLLKNTLLRAMQIGKEGCLIQQQLRRLIQFEYC